MCPSLSISQHNDIEMKGDPDSVTLPIPNCIAKDIFAGTIKNEDERDFSGETPIFGITPATTADYHVAAAPHTHKPIEDDAGARGEGFDENSAPTECNNNNGKITNNNNNLMKRKLRDFVDEHAEDEFNLVRPPPKRVSPFLNTPKQRKDERKRILRLSVYKLREMEDPESFLRKSVLINNVLRRLHKEIREEKRDYSGFGLGSAATAMSHPYYRPRRFDYDMLNNSHLPTRTAFFFDEPCFPGETEKITDDMTDSLVRSLEASSPPLSPVPTPPPSPLPQTTFQMSTPTLSPLSLSSLSSSSSSSSTLQLPGTPHPDIPSTSKTATSSLTSPLATATESVLATTASASVITTIITTTTLPSQQSTTTTTTTTTNSNTEEDMQLESDTCNSNDVSVDSISADVTSPVATNNSTIDVDVNALSSSINRNITSSRTSTNIINNSSNSHNYGTNKPTNISRTVKSEETANVGAIAGSPTSDNNNNNNNVCNANGSHVFGTSVPVDHVIAPIATSRSSILTNSSSSDVTSTNSSVLFSSTNFGTSGFLSVSGSMPFSVSSLVSSTTTMTTTAAAAMMTSAANTVPNFAFQEKQISVEMDTMFNNLIRVLGET